MKTFFPRTASWKKQWSAPEFKIQFVVTLCILIGLAVFVPHYFNFIQSRPGKNLNDQLLNHIVAKDMSIYIFTLIYFSIFVSIIYLCAFPARLLACLKAYALLTILRIITLYLFPLEPDPAILPLKDPLVGQLFYDGRVITKDLFFSGHVSILFLLFVAIPFRPIKYVVLASTLLVALFILIQHAHYTIDVVAAPVFSAISFGLAQRFIALKE